MKKILLILLLFLLPLYLVPPTSAAYGDESPDSITSFSETLPDDVLFYPDAFTGAVELADYGEISDESSSPDYVLTNILDASAFNETTATDIEIWFEVDTTDGFEGFSYAHYLDVDSGTDCDLAAYDFEQDLFVKIDEPLPSTYAWMNGTIYDPDYWNTTHIAFAIHELSGTADLYWDYGEITPLYMTLADSDHYAEGFNDVSDWILDFGYAPTSDGDLMEWAVPGDDASDSIYTNALSLSAGWYYLEISGLANVSGGRIALYAYPEEDIGGSVISIGTFWTATTGVTFKVGFNAPTGVECFRLYARNSVNTLFQPDYARISPANESGGWQHDGSTTESIVTQYGRADISSDDDVLIVNSTVSGARILIKADNTDTKIEVDTDEYQFVEWKVTDAYDADSSGGVWKLRVFDIDGIYTASYYPVSGYSSDTGIFRLNLKAWCDASSLSGLYYFKFYFNSANDDFGLDYIKVYSIANYSLTQSAGTDPSTVLYVENNALIWSLATSVYITLAHDPALSVDTSIYTTVTANITKADSSAVVGFNWEETISGARWRLVDEKTAVMQSGTLTDMRISIDVSGTWTLSTIKFIDTRDWQEIGEVEFVIPVGWDPTFIFGYDAFFIFLGLIMIPVSTMYLVRGGREEMSADKLFYGLIIFAVGFGLLVGGIMP